MKVDVIQAEESTFKSKLCWWSNWIDIAIVDISCEPFLIQMSVSRTNKKKFRNSKVTGCLLYKQVPASAIGDLKTMKSEGK